MAKLGGEKHMSEAAEPRARGPADVVFAKEVAFTDPNVDDLATLLSHLRPEVGAIILDDNSPAPAQSLRALARRLEAPGAVHIGALCDELCPPPSELPQAVTRPLRAAEAADFTPLGARRRRKLLTVVTSLVSSPAGRTCNLAVASSASVPGSPAWLIRERNLSACPIPDTHAAGGLPAAL
jgi:hypothetical protein